MRSSDYQPPNYPKDDGSHKWSRELRDPHAGYEPSPWVVWIFKEAAQKNFYPPEVPKSLREEKELGLWAKRFSEYADGGQDGPIGTYTIHNDPTEGRINTSLDSEIYKCPKCGAIRIIASGERRQCRRCGNERARRYYARHKEKKRSYERQRYQERVLSQKRGAVGRDPAPGG